MATNKLTEVAGLVAHAVMGATIKDKDGNDKTLKPTGDDNLLDLTDIVAGGSTGGSTGGTTGGNTSTPVPQLPSTVNLFSGSAVGNILLSGPTPNYDNVQDGLLLTLSNQTPSVADTSNLGANYGISNPQISNYHIDLTQSGLTTIKIPKEKLVVNSSFDISDQLSQYIGKEVKLQARVNGDWLDVNFNNKGYSFSIVSFGGTTIKVLPNTTLNMNLTVSVKDNSARVIPYDYPIPVIHVNDYKN